MKRTSQARKRLAGTFRADRHRAPDPANALDAVPAPPAHLSAGAAAAWSRFAALACAIRTLTPADLPLLELLSRTWSSIDDLERQLAADGLVIESETGARKAHPGLAALDRARALAHRLLGDLGLSPPGRERITMRPSATKNPYAEL